MKNRTRTVDIILLVLIIAFVLWKFVIKTAKVTLADNSTIYKKGNNYYFNNNGDEVKIDQAEYNRLKSNIDGQCNNPNQTAVADAPCDYFKFKGKIDCNGQCKPVYPIVRNCPQTSGNCSLPSGTPGTLRLTDSDKKGCYYTCFS